MEICKHNHHVCIYEIYKYIFFKTVMLKYGCAKSSQLFSCLLCSCILNIVLWKPENTLLSCLYEQIWNVQAEIIWMRQLLPKTVVVTNCTFTRKTFLLESNLNQYLWWRLLQTIHILIQARWYGTKSNIIIILIKYLNLDIARVNYMSFHKIFTQCEFC